MQQLLNTHFIKRKNLILTNFEDPVCQSATLCKVVSSCKQESNRQNLPAIGGMEQRTPQKTLSCGSGRGFLKNRCVCQFSSAPETIRRQCAFFAMLHCRQESKRQRLLQLAKVSVCLQLAKWSNGSQKTFLSGKNYGIPKSYTR